MTSHLHRTLCLLFLVSCTYVVPILSDCYENIVTYTIRSTTNPEFVLDATNATSVTIQEYDGSPGQHFTIECANKAGLFYLINEATGTGLDFITENATHYVTATPPQQILFQQWFLRSRGRIVNAALIFAIDVEEFVAGANVTLTKDGTNSTQLWSLVDV